MTYASAGDPWKKRWKRRKLPKPPEKKHPIEYWQELGLLSREGAIVEQGNVYLSIPAPDDEDHVVITGTEDVMSWGYNLDRTYWHRSKRRE